MQNFDEQSTYLLSPAARRDGPWKNSWTFYSPRAMNIHNLGTNLSPSVAICSGVSPLTPTSYDRSEQGICTSRIREIILLKPERGLKTVFESRCSTLLCGHSSPTPFTPRIAVLYSIEDGQSESTLCLRFRFALGGAKAEEVQGRGSVCYGTSVI
jgi:hypothetical protein